MDQASVDLGHCFANSANCIILCSTGCTCIVCLICPLGLSKIVQPLKLIMNLFSVKAGLRHESCERILLAIPCVGSMSHFNHMHYGLYPSLQMHSLSFSTHQFG